MFTFFKSMIFRLQSHGGSLHFHDPRVYNLDYASEFL